MASSSSSSQILPASSSLSWNYDVFLSFREDTRKTFVDHLYNALEQQGIHTYKDDETLGQGESIRPALTKAIEKSQIAVVIFSENYADSSWCLDELAYIMKCKEERGQIIMPIFYHVDPSDVRKQKGKYGEAFSKHESENNNKVESFRKALVDASNISGWEPKNIVNGNEAECIKEIVATISHILPIGIEDRVQDLISKLEIGSGGVLMLGIWGVGGGGKTTLAASVCEKISSSFDSCCFIENIREESNKKGLEHLKEKIISLGVGRVRQGRNMIKSRLCRRKVLIVLDDVDHFDQLNKLAGSNDWFGEGSRIIITTRDKHLLNAHKVNVIHDVSLLNDDEAIKLFHKHAHPNYPPIKGYELLSKDVVSYAKGLPLALKVLGSYLCDKNMNEWKSALARLKEIPHGDIFGKLKISFDGLQPYEKQLFLDIACFFRGKRKYVAMQTLDVCGFHSKIGIMVLIEKALITVNLDDEFDMHDLIQEMGHYIVRKEHPNNPEKHTRVWKGEDVRKICAMDATTELDEIEAIRVDSDDAASLHHCDVVANMRKLRWIDWSGGFRSSLPTTNFPREELCCLILRSSFQSQLWEGYKYLPNLRVIKLWSLKGLEKTPDFDGLPNLERFEVCLCPDLKEIHPSIGRLERLVFLIIDTCENLKMFPPITQSQKLETFDAECCLEEEHFSLPDNRINNPIGLRFFNRSLRELCLWSCNLGDGDINDSVFWELSNLQELNIGANKFSRLNFSLLQLPRLKLLTVSFCSDLVVLSGLPTSIAVLQADFCDSLVSVGDISNCKWLWNVSFIKTDNLGQLGLNKILDSMLQGNAIEDHFYQFHHFRVSDSKGARR